MKADDKIRKVRISFLYEKPFFANLSMYLELRETQDIETVGVDFKGNLYFNADFVNTLSDGDLRMVVAHETLHLAFLHLLRKGNRDNLLWNIATDLAINIMLKKDGFHIPHDFLFNMDYDNMIAEEIYNRLYQKAKKVKIKVMGIGNKSKKHGKGEKDDSNKNVQIADIKGKRIDKHIYPSKNENTKKDKHKDMDKEVISDQDLKKITEEWKKRIVEATTFAKQKGQIPFGLERLIDKLIPSRINWKGLLYRYITNEIPFDVSFSRPHKKSESVGVYLPHTVRQNIDIIIAVDSSGSISDSEIKEFISEIYGISKSFSNITMTLLVCDSAIHDIYEIKNGFDVNSIKIHGRGGTDFRPIYEWILENKPYAKFLIYFTDGLGDYPNSESVKTLWVLKNDYDVPFGEKIIFKGE